LEALKSALMFYNFKRIWLMRLRTTIVK